MPPAGDIGAGLPRIIPRVAAPHVHLQPWDGPVGVVLADHLTRLAATQRSIRMRFFVAYVKEGGIRRLREPIRTALSVAGSSLEVWCHAVAHPTRQITTAQGVAALQDLGARVILVHPAGREMHMKCYVLETDREAVIVVGSANLTESALTSNVEAVAVLSGDRDAADIKAALERVDHVDAALRPPDGPVRVLDRPIFQDADALLLLKDLEHPGYGYGPFATEAESLRGTPFEGRPAE